MLRYEKSARKSGSIWSVWALRIFRPALRSGTVLNVGLRCVLERRERSMLGERRSDFMRSEGGEAVVMVMMMGTEMGANGWTGVIEFMILVYVLLL